MQITNCDEVFSQLARATGQWLVILRFNINWERESYKIHGLLNSVPWLNAKRDRQAIGDGIVIAICQTADEAESAYLAVKGNADVVLTDQDAEPQEDTSLPEVYVFVINPSGEVEIDSV